MRVTLDIDKAKNITGATLICAPHEADHFRIGATQLGVNLDSPWIPVDGELYLRLPLASLSLPSSNLTDTKGVIHAILSECVTKHFKQYPTASIIESPAPQYSSPISTGTPHDGGTADSNESRKIIKTCDLHTHILPAELPDLSREFGPGPWVNLRPAGDGKVDMYKGDQFFRKVDANCYDPVTRLRECDDANVHVQVLSTVPVMFSYWAKPEHTLKLSILLNDHIADVVQKHPTRFAGLATLPMQSAELAIQELRRCMAKGFLGIQIGTNINGLPLSDPQFFPIFQEAEKLNACILVHPWEMMGQERMQKYWLPWLVGMPAETSFSICSLIFGGVFERLPNLRWCFAHGGGSFALTIGRIQHGFDVRPDLCAIDNPVSPQTYLGKFWVDSLLHDAVDLEHVIRRIGKDKVVIGSDYPFPLGEQVPGALVKSLSTLSPEEKENILWKNALEFLGVNEGYFCQHVASVATPELGSAIAPVTVVEELPKLRYDFSKFFAAIASAKEAIDSVDMAQSKIPGVD